MRLEDNLEELDMSFSKWTQCKLGDLVLFQRGHDLPKTKMKVGDIPVIGSSGIIGYHNEFTTKAPCITVGRSGSVGNPIYINEDSWAHNTTLYIKQFFNTDPKFIYYYLKQLNLSHYAGGSAVPTLNRNHIHSIDVYVPTSIEEQKAIADILSSLDEKIELNNQMNQTLEEMAQALFKRWFVDFEFPNEEGQPYKSSGGKMVESELGMIPYNWIPSNIFDNITEYSKKNKEANNYPVLSVTKESKFLLSSDVFSIETYEFYDRTVFSKKIKNYKIIHKNSVGYNPSRANIGSIAMLEDYEIGVISPIYKVFSINDTILPTVFKYYMKLDNFIMQIKHYSSGTTRQNFDIECFKYFDIVLPPKIIQEEFEEIINKFTIQIKKNVDEIYILENLRDTLLPKLMSGEIRVSDLC